MIAAGPLMTDGLCTVGPGSERLRTISHALSYHCTPAEQGYDGRGRVLRHVMVWAESEKRVLEKKGIEKSNCFVIAQ